MEGKLWVARLFISDRTAHKIRSRHGLDPLEVEDAVVCRRGLEYVWDSHPTRGVRALVKSRVREKRVLVVLYPADTGWADTYHLGSAYPI
ncbi:hypothetical protein [Nocardiopsis baichengensis]|uniref:hypothetical protein n=1 Tax=Nocardiopsis baichengensis TaxID=280240 RepID=UPI0003789D2C|nr:hypothetical protein [Nocardiopsis baichengensis]